jgi:exosome complex component RRP40
MNNDDPTQLATSLLNSIEQAKKWKSMVVFPGDNITSVIQEYLGEGRVVRLGAGLRQNDTQGIVVVKPGTLHFLAPGRFWVTTNGRRYAPKSGDLVIGTVTERLGARGYRVNIRSSSSAMLPSLSFDGASKRNHPDLPVGALVYARVEEANKHIETELTCCADSGAKKDWMTGEAQFGKLVGGTTVECSHSLARNLLEDEAVVLMSLAQHVKFEVAIGFNGWVWIDSESPMTTIVITNAILNSEHVSDDKIPQMVNALCGEFLPSPKKNN